MTAYLIFSLLIVVLLLIVTVKLGGGTPMRDMWEQKESLEQWESKVADFSVLDSESLDRSFNQLVGDEPCRLTREESRERWNQARAFWNDWGPIGVFQYEDSGPEDEYEAYVWPTLKMLERGKSVYEIAAYMRSVAERDMELSKFQDPERHARILRRWYIHNWSGTTG